MKRRGAHREDAFEIAKKSWCYNFGDGVYCIAA